MDGNAGAGAANFVEYGTRPGDMSSLLAVGLGQAARAVATNIPYSGSYACAVVTKSSRNLWISSSLTAIAAG